MEIQSIIDKARRQSHASSVNYTNDDALLDLNNRRSDMIGRIQSEVDEGWYWTWAIPDTGLSADQNEYNIKKVNVGDTWRINQIDGVSVKYKTDDEYIPLDSVHPSSLDYDLDYYKTYAGKPFYFIKDESIFIYPSPTEDVSDGIKIYCVLQPNDVTLTSTEEDIKLAPRFHQNLVDGICADYWYANGNEQK